MLNYYQMLCSHFLLYSAPALPSFPFVGLLGASGLQGMQGDIHVSCLCQIWCKIGFTVCTILDVQMENQDMSTLQNNNTNKDVFSAPPTDHKMFSSCQTIQDRADCQNSLTSMEARLGKNSKAPQQKLEQKWLKGEKTLQFAKSPCSLIQTFSRK